MRWLHSLRPLGFVLTASIGAGCGQAPDASGPATPTETAAPTPAAGATGSPSRAELLVEADRRELGPAIRRGLTAPEADVRRVAALALARLHQPGNLPRLRDTLRDPDPQVRMNASLGVASLEEEAPAGAEEMLLHALAAESDPGVRLALLEDLGRVGGVASLPALRAAASDPSTKRAACMALGSFGQRRQAVPGDLLRDLGAGLARDPDAESRLACSYALGRVPPPTDAADLGGLASGLTAAAGDADPRVRAMAVRALGRLPEPPAALLSARTTDPDWQVSVQAFRSLARVPGVERDYARSLRGALDRALAEPDGPKGPELHVLLTALESARSLALAAPVREVAAECLSRLGDRSRETTASRDRGLAHCGAAALVDAGRRWPTRLADCGLDQVSDSERAVLGAEVLTGVSGAEQPRLRWLSRSYEEGDARVKQAVLAAVATIRHRDSGELLLRGLRDADKGVIIAAADAVTAALPTWRDGPDGEPPAAPGPALAATADALRAAQATLLEANDLEGLQSWARAAAAFGDQTFVPELTTLGSHSNVGVRRTAGEALRSLGLAAPSVVASPPDNPIDPAGLPPAGARPRVEVTTTRGRLVLELLGDEAPTTTARFLGLVAEGYFDGLSFHRVVPAFVVQGGDPRGDGYGGPGWSQRCEDNRVRYERGTVGMALAGRDTGGSQFFITHGPQPHLEGRYTAFGRVLEGMEVVDQLQQGDRIERVQLVP